MSDVRNWFLEMAEQVKPDSSNVAEVYAEYDAKYKRYLNKHEHFDYKSFSTALELFRHTYITGNYMKEHGYELVELSDESYIWVKKTHNK